MYWLPELVRSDLEAKFFAIQDEQLFWEFTENTIGDYVFSDDKIIKPDGNIDLEILNEYSPDSKSTTSKGRLFIGSMRIMQKRIKSQKCTRQSQIERYQKEFKECYQNNYHFEDEETEDIPTTNQSWGQY
jgi:hypothetical protein